MKLVVVLAGLALAAPATVAGQQPQDRATDRQAAERQADRQPAGLIASDAVTGATVKDRQGEDVGTIDRLIVNHSTGEVAHVIVASGGLLGVGRDHVQVAWDAFEFTGDNGRVVAHVERAKLDEATSVDRDHFDLRWNAGATGLTDEPRADRDRVQPGTQAQPATTSQLISSERLHGAEVRDQARNDYGTIERLMIDPDEGEVKYLVIGARGFLGIGRDHMLVPFDNVQVAMIDNDLVVTLQEDVLKQAPRSWIGTD